MCDSNFKPFWDRKYGKESICGITCIRLRPGCNKKGISYCVYLPCEHGFYRSAIQKWAIKHRVATCPVCRQEFRKSLVL